MGLFGLKYLYFRIHRREGKPVPTCSVVRRLARQKDIEQDQPKDAVFSAGSNSPPDELSVWDTCLCNKKAAMLRSTPERNISVLIPVAAFRRALEELPPKYFSRTGETFVLPTDVIWTNPVLEDGTHDRRTGWAGHADIKPIQPDANVTKGQQRAARRAVRHCAKLVAKIAYD